MIARWLAAALRALSERPYDITVRDTFFSNATVVIRIQDQIVDPDKGLYPVMQLLLKLAAVTPHEPFGRYFFVSS